MYPLHNANRCLSTSSASSVSQFLVERVRNGTGNLLNCVVVKWQAIAEKLYAAGRTQRNRAGAELGRSPARVMNE